MELSENEDGKIKVPRIRGLTSLSAIRKELVKLYCEAKAAGADRERVQYYRMLCFLLASAAQVRKDESLEDMERRLDAIEERAGNTRQGGDSL